jgi:uncharacterized C2H2 Zn-finger protein
LKRARLAHGKPADVLGVTANLAMGKPSNYDSPYCPTYLAQFKPRYPSFTWQKALKPATPLTFSLTKSGSRFRDLTVDTVQAPPATASNVRSNIPLVGLHQTYLASQVHGTHAALASSASPRTNSPANHTPAPNHDPDTDAQPDSHHNFLCSYCDASFKYVAHKVRHVVKRHGDPKPPLRTTPTCGVCHATFGTDDALSAHERTHYAFSCEHCDFNTDSRKTMMEHSKKHSERSLKCAFCDLLFPTNASRSAHQRSHNREAELWTRAKKPRTKLPATSAELDAQLVHDFAVMASGNTAGLLSGLCASDARRILPPSDTSMRAFGGSEGDVDVVGDFD